MFFVYDSLPGCDASFKWSAGTRGTVWDSTDHGISIIAS